VKLKRYILIISILICPIYIFSQTGGRRAYEFLNLTHSGLVASLGGANVSLKTNDPGLAYHNPSLLFGEMDKSLSLSYSRYLAGINYGQVLYSGSLKTNTTFAAGLTYINYGNFTEADASGTITGSFSASEYAFSLIISKRIDSAFTVGIDIKPVLSHLEKYSSFGMAVDLGASWHPAGKPVSAGIVIRNTGCQITTYTGGKHQLTPFEIMAGATVKPYHSPFRFSLTIRHLEKFDLTHQYTSTNQMTAGNKSDGFLENIMRHFVVGAEIIPHKNFYFSAGYDYQRRKELMVESKSGFTGFSWGFGINTSFLSFEFGRATYHIAGSSNHISLITRPDMIFRKLSRRN